MNQTQIVPDNVKTALVAVVLLAPDEAARILGVTEGTLSVWRSTHRYGLPFVRVGRKIRYKASDLEEFIRTRTIGGESQVQAAPSRKRRASRV